MTLLVVYGAYFDMLLAGGAATAAQLYWFMVLSVLTWLESAL